MQNKFKKDYRMFRDQIFNFIRRDIEGPYSKDEVIDEMPSSKYSLGVLFPQLEVGVDSDMEGDIDLTSKSVNEEDVTDHSSAFYPSAAGLSFTLKQDVKKISLQVSYGTYKKITASDYTRVKINAKGLKVIFEKNITFREYFDYDGSTLQLKLPINKYDLDILKSLAEDNVIVKDALFRVYRLYKGGWYREHHVEDIELSLKDGKTNEYFKNSSLSISVVSKTIPNSQNKIVTCSIVNTAKSNRPQTSTEKSVYQTCLKVSLPLGNYFEDMNKSSMSIGQLDDIEEKSLELLYRNKEVYTVGHGISAQWVTDKDGCVRQIHTETLPSYTVPQMDFNIDVNSEVDIELKISRFAFGDESYIFDNLSLLIEQYEGWISKIENDASNLPIDILHTAKLHIERCHNSSARMREGLNIIRNNDKAMMAFRSMNEAMAMQRVHTRMQTEKTLPSQPKLMPETYNDSYDEWRPFQIAFIIMNLQSMYDDKCKERDLVDLIWFPTGGGKTEAYLGLTAFTIFIRRIQYPDNYGGTAVIMRYTLRLLTSQQFQRACTLICACEKIRRNNSEYGDEEINVGLWIGSASTPNDLKSASIKIREINTSSKKAGNPFQVITCPWCGTYTSKHNGEGANCYQIKNKPKKHLVIWCPNDSCDFSYINNGLPIKVIDEDIYNSPPTLLFGTVDKFAMLPWCEGVSSIFALNHGNENLSPSLIIQDELHLISGSLGTMVGLFETAIDILTSRKGIKPKIIASTATIRRAHEQCMSLYARNVQQFPSPGLDSTDSFFARESPINDETPGRLYIGVMPSGKTATSLQIHLTANVIQSVEYIDSPNDIKDAYWTQVIYCNSIRELGSSKTVAYDDVKERSKIIMSRLGRKPRYYIDRNITELTSRIDGDKIPDILRQLEVKYPSTEAVDILLATNMISVGVDIDRLGLMVILGQPKTTSEYIQASSRVGRKYPGLVIAQLSPTKSRDRSHYEQFAKYHQSLYRFVEPTSVTPFSPPARDKALHAVLFTLIRHAVGLHKNSELSDFINKKDEIQEIIQQIINRVSTIDISESHQTENELQQIIDRLSEIDQNAEGVSYVQIPNSNTIPIMKSPTDTKSKAQYPTPQSMRNSDSECYITLENL